MSISMQQWYDILINFVIDLLNNNKYTNIMIVVDKFTKLWYFIAFKFLDIETVVDAFIKNVFKLHELSDTIISDHDSQFVSTFWKTLCTRLKIETQLSITYHFKINNQIKNTNSIIKQYLWMYCSYFRNN